MDIFGWYKKKKQQEVLTAEQWQERERLRRENKELDEARKNADFKIMLLKKQEEELEVKKRVLGLQADIEEEFGDVENSDEQNPESLAVQFLGTLMGTNKAGVAQSNPILAQNVQNAPTPADIPIEKIRETWNSVPEIYKKVAQEMSDDELINYIKSKNPIISEKNLRESIEVVRGVSPVPPSPEKAPSA